MRRAKLAALMPSIALAHICRDVFPSSADPAVLEYVGVGESIRAQRSEDGSLEATFWVVVFIRPDEGDEEGAEHVLSCWFSGPSDSLSRPHQERFVFDGPEFSFVRQFTAPVPNTPPTSQSKFHSTLNYRTLPDLPITFEIPNA